jgi:cyclopropane fatty-acyl-phospholipid synthase-like methyltransferase
LGKFDKVKNRLTNLFDLHCLWPFTPDKYATLGAALRLSAGARVLDLGSGSGEMLCTWARDHGIVGTGIDMSPLFTAQAQSRAMAAITRRHRVDHKHKHFERLDWLKCLVPSLFSRLHSLCTTPGAAEFAH